MPTVDERLASLEARMDAVTELKALITDLRGDMRGQFSELREEMNRQFVEFRTDVNRRFGEVDGRFGEVRDDMNGRFGEVREDMNRQSTGLREDMNRGFEQVGKRLDRLEGRNEVLDDRMDRHFRWLVGIQISILIAVIVALIETSAR